MDVEGPAAGGSILAYFSHSYRDTDREVNAFFWRLFHSAGFFFTIDPQSKVFSIPYLESMVARANCFVAVITKRTGAPAGCSSYILFEYGLALQARKPWLVFAESGLSGASFPSDPERVLPFNRHRLPSRETDFKTAITRLADKMRGEPNPDDRLKQPGGLLMSADAAGLYTSDVVKALATEMERHGTQLKVVDSDFGATFKFCLELEKYDFLIMEVRDRFQAPWLTAYALGRAIPTIRVCHLAPGETADSVALPTIVSRHRPEHTDESSVVYWRNVTELHQGVLAHINKLGTDRIEFHDLDEGLRYFKRAGRNAGNVFVSSAQSSDTLAQRLIAGLRLEGIEFFHYRVKSAIPLGDSWQPTLKRQIESSSIFVALLDKEYLQSEWCRYELSLATARADAGLLRIHAHLLADGSLDDATQLGIGQFQVGDHTGSDEQGIVAEVLAHVDRALRADVSSKQPHASVASSASAATPVLTEADRDVLVDILTSRLVSEGTERPAWVAALLIKAGIHQQLAGEDYSGSARTVATVLVTKAEALGRLPDNRIVLLLLVNAIVRGQMVSYEHVPALSAIAERLEKRSS